MREVVLFIMKYIAASVIVAAVVLFCLSPTSGQDVLSSTVTLNIPSQGIVQGDYDTTLWSRQTFMRFRGIPYAESPRGPLRFKVSKLRQKNDFSLLSSDY